MVRSRRLWRLLIILGVGAVACQSNERGRSATARPDVQPEAAADVPAVEPAAIADVPPLPAEVLHDEPAAVAPAASFSEPPPLVPIEPQVYVVEDYDVPVYYTDGHYWVARGDTWYHTPRWDQPWVVIDVALVPTLVVHKQHDRYVHYRDPVATVWHEPRHYRSLPRVFYEPPPLVTIDVGVSVVENYDVPVYYTDGHYYQYRENRWYRTSRYDAPWEVAHGYMIPTKISGRHHDHYVHYRRSERANVWHEPRLPWRSFDKKLERERAEDRQARVERREREHERRVERDRDRDRRERVDDRRGADVRRDRDDERRKAERRRERQQADQRREADSRRDKERKDVDGWRDRGKERLEAERRRERAREAERSKAGDIRKTKARERDAPKVKVTPRKSEAKRPTQPWEPRKVEKAEPPKKRATPPKKAAPPSTKAPPKKALPWQR